MVVDVDVPMGVTLASTQLYYSEQAPTWQTRVWTAVEATQVSGNRYGATLSPALAAKALNFYAFTTDTLNASTSSAMYDSKSVVTPMSTGGGNGASAGASGENSAGASGENSAGASGGNLTGGAPSGGGSSGAGTAVGGTLSQTTAGMPSSSGGPAPSPAGPPAISDGSCTCNFAPRPLQGPTLWLALVAGLLVRRRATRFVATGPG